MLRERRAAATDLNRTIVNGLVGLAILMVLGALGLAFLRIPPPEWLGQSIPLIFTGLLAMGNGLQPRNNVTTANVEKVQQGGKEEV